MKRTTLFLACMLPAAVLLQAQTNKLSIGINAGPNSNLLYGKESGVESKDFWLTAFSAGISVQYALPKVVSFVSGISYNVKGEIIKGKSINAAGDQLNFKAKYSYNYITLPVLARFSVGKRTKFFAEGGGFVSYLTKAINRFSGSLNLPDTDQTDFFKRMDAGVSFGLGASVPLTQKFMLTVQARNDLGLVNISNVPVFKDGFIKTNSASLLVGIAYTLGNKKTG